MCVIEVAVLGPEKKKKEESKLSSKTPSAQHTPALLAVKNTKNVIRFFFEQDIFMWAIEQKNQTGSRERRGEKYRELYNNFETNKWQELTGRETR